MVYAPERPSVADASYNLVCFLLWHELMNKKHVVYIMKIDLLVHMQGKDTRKFEHWRLTIMDSVPLFIGCRTICCSLQGRLWKGMDYARMHLLDFRVDSFESL